MQEEKRFNNPIWYRYRYRYRDYAFKVNILDSGNAVVWVNFKDYNIAFPMIIREFLYEMEEYNFNVMVNCDWNEHRGFEVKQEEVDLLIGEILNFCTENDPETMNLIEKYIDNEWYD